MKHAWVDVRALPADQLEAVVDAAIHAKVQAVVADDAELLAKLPPTVLGVLIGEDAAPGGAEGVVAARVPGVDDGDGLAGQGGVEGAAPAGVTRHDDEGGLGGQGGVEGAAPIRVTRIDDERELPSLVRANGAAWVHVRDDRTLKLACDAAVGLPYTIVEFADPTKIPLEIVLAAADRAPGRLITVCADLEEAGIVVDVLERGSEGVLLSPRTADDVFALTRLLSGTSPDLRLSTLTVDKIEHHGLGDRVCVDTCSHFREDEGILVGSYSTGFILCCSETHPLPYMPTRPFRVNAGALHSYVLGPDNRTNYLSELRSGGTVLAVDSDGRTRRVVVGRAKLESRPLLTITAHSADGVVVSLTVQDDWHVRVLGPGAKVRNVTELQNGDELLGYLATDQRHVGIPIGEFCRES